MIQFLARAGIVTLLLVQAQRAASQSAEPQGILKAEFLFDSASAASFSTVHASTILETRDGLIAAWFGRSRKNADNGGCWLSRHVEGEWTQPLEVADGAQPDGTRHHCWNPVLFKMPDGVVILFYKVGSSPQTWWGMFLTSRDNGRTWEDAKHLPEGILGPVKNKPVRLADGAIISSSSTSSVDRPGTWRIHFELTIDAGKSWTVAHPPTSSDTGEVNALQPSILIHARNRLQAVGRTGSGRVFETWSQDGGRHWSPVTLTVLPNPNAGLDAVTLRNGRHMIVYNHTTRGRSPLNVALSADGMIWEAALVLESAAGEYSYPAVIQTSDGLVHVTYTWKRQRIKHVIIDPMHLTSIPMPAGTWPPTIRSMAMAAVIAAADGRSDRAAHLLATVEGDEGVQGGVVKALVDLLGGDRQSAERGVRELTNHADPAQVEAEVNAVGYVLLRAEKAEQALEVFELNTRVFPEAFNTWDSLGEAHMILRHDDDAIRSYERSLELNPRNANATTMIARIREGAGPPN